MSAQHTPGDLPDFSTLHVERYSHGGARVWRWLSGPGGTRDLVLDLYSPEDRREAIIAALTAFPAMLAALEEIDAVIRDSHGVYGWHLNGDGAPWDEFSDITDAISTALAQAKGEGVTS